MSEIQINEHTLKVEKETAKAMIEGFIKNNHCYYATIYCAHKYAVSMENEFKAIPKIVLTPIRGEKRGDYPLSDIGNKLNARAKFPGQTLISD